MVALKDLMNYKEKQPWFSKSKGLRKPKEEDQEQIKDLVRQNHPFGKPPFCQSLSVYNRD